MSPDGSINWDLIDNSMSDVEFFAANPSISNLNEVTEVPDISIEDAESIDNLAMIMYDNNILKNPLRFFINAQKYNYVKKEIDYIDAYVFIDKNVLDCSFISRNCGIRMNVSIGIMKLLYEKMCEGSVFLDDVTKNLKVTGEYEMKKLDVNAAEFDSAKAHKLQGI